VVVDDLASSPCGPSAAGSQRLAQAESLLFGRLRPVPDAEADSAVTSAGAFRASKPTVERATTVTQNGFMIRK
jgi:hypothetical protein